MTPASLRAEKKARTEQAIASAALDRFAERGFAAVSLAEIAAAAGVGERTLYRYFADKEELLFAEDAAWREALRTALADRPPDEPAFAALGHASAAVTAALEHRRDEIRRRQAVIAAAAPLQARERAKHAAWEQVLADGLRARGVDEAPARLLGRVAVACFDEALARWLAPARASRPLSAEVAAAFDALRASLTEP